MSSGKIAISIALHDLRSEQWEQQQPLVERLRSAGIDRMALMVIPEKSEDAGRHRAFGEWLFEEAAEGGELFCHGHRHRCNPALERSRLGVWQNRITDGEAEFAGLARSVGQNQLREALQAFANLQCGHPFGFVAPTWHAPSWIQEEALRRGVVCVETRWRLAREGKQRWSVPLSLFAGSDRAFWRSLKLARMALQCNIGLLRLALHPVDFATPERETAMLKLIETLLKRHRPASYAELLF